MINDQHTKKFDFLLAKVDTKTYSKYLDGVIPLLTQPDYSVSKVYNIPIPVVNGAYSILENVPDNFFNSSSSQRTLEFTETKFTQNCIAYNGTFFICKNSEPIRITPIEGN